MNTSVLTVPTDTEIAVELALELVNAQRIPPFKFGIYYDAKKGPARVTVHKITNNGTMGQVEFANAATSRMWCALALGEGYTVVRIIGRDDMHQATLSRRKRYYEQKIKFNAMTPAQRQALDDEIPF